MKFNSALLASVLLCAVSATSINKRVDTATVNACLSGIEEAIPAGTSLPKIFEKLFDGSKVDSDKILLDTLDTAKTVISKIQKFSEPCTIVDDSYTPEQNARLVKGVKPLISSLAKTFKLLIDNKDQVLNVYKIGDFVATYTKPVNETLGKFITWQKENSSSEVTEATKKELDEVAKLIDDMTEIYGQ